MRSYSITTKPFGKQAILVEWPKEVDSEILEDIMSFVQFLKQHCLDNKIWEIVPAYNSLTLIQRSGTVVYQEMDVLLKKWYAEKTKTNSALRFLWRIPVCYEEEFGIDLADVAQRLKKSTNEIVKLHTENPYTVYGIGFLPGFMYLGGVPKTLEIDRKKIPRLKVKQGSVGLAGKQTGIYPQDSPGGWNIIGSCPIPIFDPRVEEPCLVNVGDQIQFYQISKAAYDLHKIEATVGIYQIEKVVLNA